MTVHEKLGEFYLGRAGSDLVLYDSRDLVTHAVIVGMTGSGKTGLGIALLEEAAIDGIPALVIDPKGDLANLALRFPALSPADFRPWVGADEARRHNLDLDAYAAVEAERWKQGLAAWGQDGARIRRLEEAAEVALYTPGSRAATPVSILRSFAAPAPAVREDGELLRDRAASAATGLLGLLGIDADPIRSREHILLATLLGSAWRDGRDLDLGALIAAVQKPPLQRIGVFELETFFPAAERFGLAMALNNLLAAPGFETWLEGEPLDVGSLLFGRDGRPRCAVMTIAHLSDAERMWFVSLLLNEVVGWMRTQAGTTSLRAVVYMDEMMGYLPPVANPPSKAPLLALLKQARAYGVGMVLATQNPVDLDYKALANAGTWMIGRLQTERDKARLLDGLEGAQAGRAADRAELDRMLSGLEKRHFLLHNVHDARPVVFETRWCLSYLAGPLTREQIRELSRSRKAAAGAGAGAAAAAQRAPEQAVPAPPLLPPDVACVYLPVRSQRPPGAALVYRPALLGVAAVGYADRALAAPVERLMALLRPLAGGATAPGWQDAEAAPIELDALEAAPQEGAGFASLPAEAAQAKSYERWRRELVEWVARSARLELWRSGTLDAVSRPGESERDFRIRLRDLVHERRDRDKEALRARYAPQLERVEAQIRRAEQRRASEAEQARQQKLQSAISIGATLLGAVLGRKAMSASTLGRATTAARGVGRATKEAQDVARAEENVDLLRRRLGELDARFQENLAALDRAYDPALEKLETVTLRPKRGDVSVRLVALAWVPEWRPASGAAVPAWK